ncbi:hypothetical protein [Marinobacter nauticus]|uniref:hypothetical protein n=1 Tax=Marinobacter nauticus TaxID=2743 RepID=UPI001C55D27C|nr:hypothetical protein [Marinobacter nauticus]MBW3199590.1 hypothetical protein [Marinobacter nauticus]MBY6185000.1 hypothetical protein [Marinobacter nauticus]
MRRKHEQSIIDAFSNYFLKVGRQRGRQTNRFSLDGQDSVLGGDYIFTANTNFALVEFKYEKRDLKAEGDKRLRKLLCEKLDADKVRLSQSLQCHFIAWSQKEMARNIYFNKYHPEICTREIFPQAELHQKQSDPSSRIRAEQMVSSFLNAELGTNFRTFRQYTQWLLSIGETGEGGVELMLDNPDSNDLEILEFSNLDLVNDWLVQNGPSSTPSPSPGP